MTGSSDESLKQLRHSAAHLLAAAVIKLYPNAKNAIGPAIDDGFYQDFDLGEMKISDEDFPKIDAMMREILATWDDCSIRAVPVEQAQKDFAWNPYKSELIAELATQGTAITETKQGEFLDLCKGGHLEHPKNELTHFKLLSTAGAYWRGDEKNPMLTRIYGTAWLTKAELDSYLDRRVEAERRDHRTLGQQLDLFTFSDLVGAGLPLFTPKGTLLRDLLNDFVWQLRQAAGYEKVEIPHITKKELYVTSGHWDRFKDDLFKITTRDGHEFAMKPMNCPHHTQLYARKQWSYRELPQRYANTTMVYRDEQTGELHGLSRVRAITQDDAHVFCRHDQVKGEVTKIWTIVNTFYRAFNFDLRVVLSSHDPNTPEKYLGHESLWTSAERSLRAIGTAQGMTFEEVPGEAAFYGPKIDFMARDAIGREWQVATIQLDLTMPERFDLTCVNETGEKERIVMIHAAVMGAIERFLSVLIEHVAGKFPLWLAPVQLKLLPIADRHSDSARVVAQELKQAGYRVEIDVRPESVGKKIRTAQLEQVPYMLVVGDREIAANQVAIRSRDAGDLGPMSLEQLLNRLAEESAPPK
jgi:threonyl-tRNA synthetase